MRRLVRSFVYPERVHKVFNSLFQFMKFGWRKPNLTSKILFKTISLQLALIMLPCLTLTSSAIGESIILESQKSLINVKIHRTPKFFNIDFIPISSVIIPPVSQFDQKPPQVSYRFLALMDEIKKNGDNGSHNTSEDAGKKIVPIHVAILVHGGALLLIMILLVLFNMYWESQGVMRFFRPNDERVHHYQRGRTSIAGLRLESDRIIETERLVVVVTARLVLRSFLLERR